MVQSGKAGRPGRCQRVGLQLLTQQLEAAGLVLVVSYDRTTLSGDAYDVLTMRFLLDGGQGGLGQLMTELIANPEFCHASSDTKRSIREL